MGFGSDSPTFALLLQLCFSVAQVEGYDDSPFVPPISGKIFCYDSSSSHAVPTKRPSDIRTSPFPSQSIQVVHLLSFRLVPRPRHNLCMIPRCLPRVPRIEIKRMTKPSSVKIDSPIGRSRGCIFSQMANSPTLLLCLISIFGFGCGPTPSLSPSPSTSIAEG